MSISYEKTGRSRQKTRTRRALVEAARELIAAGETPSVEEAAALADISRATAYRYFPNQRSMLAEVYPQIEATSLLGEDATGDPEQRFALVVAALTDLTLEHEAEARTALRLSLELDKAERKRLLVRKGRAIGWLEDALSPLEGQLAASALRRLVLATRSACGIEALVWLTDVAGLSRKEAAETMRWSAQALYMATLEEAAR